MPRGLIKLTQGERSWYLEWSTIVDAPVTYGLTREELEEHVREEYGAQGVRELPERMLRVEATGTSFLGSTLERTVSGNRAGPRETELTIPELIDRSCFRREAPDGS